MTEYYFYPRTGANEKATRGTLSRLKGRELVTRGNIVYVACVSVFALQTMNYVLC